MADISAMIHRKSLRAKQKAAIRTIRQQTKEKIRAIKLSYAENPGQLAQKMRQGEDKRASRMQRWNARLAYIERQPKEYSLGEDLVSAISHGIGAGLSVAAIVLLVLLSVFHAPPASRTLHTVSYVIFGAFMFILYMMSTLYHALTPYGARRVFSVLTHDAIFALIAGTYTPFVLTVLGGTAGWALFFVIWGVAVIGIALYSVFREKFRYASVLAYIVAGWLVIVLFAATPLASGLPSLSRAMLFSGGAAYTVGGIFYLFPQYKWTHCIFHIFTLGGSILHFFSVYFSLAR